MSFPVEESNRRPLAFPPFASGSKKLYTASMCGVLDERDEREDRHPQYFEDLRQNLEKNLREDASVEEFVEHIWGLDKDTVETIMSEDWPIDPGMLARYRAAFDSQQRVFRPRPHTAFRSISSRIIGDVFEYFSMDPRSVEDEFWDGKGKRHLESHFARSDPDLVRIWKMRSSAAREKDTPPVWEEIKALAEFSTFRTVDSYSTYSLPLPRTQLSVRTASKARKYDTTYPSHSIPTLKRRRSISAQLLDEDSEFILHPTKRMRPSCKFTDDQLRFASYAVECLTQWADRRYVTGIFIDACHVSLYYFDRNLAIRTVAFDFGTVKGARYLALTLFALSQVDMKHAGYESLLCSLEQTVAWGKAERLVPIRNPSQDVENFCFVLPRSPPSELPGARYWIVDEWVDSFYGVIGHGMSTFLVRQGATGKGVSNDQSIMKMVWWPASTQCNLEAKVVRYLQDQLPAWRNHLLDITYEASWDAASLGFPWVHMQVAKPTVSKWPLLHVSVSNDCRPLWQAGSIQNFRKVFLDCLEFHHAAYSKGQVLHGAICEKSMTYCTDHSESGNSLLKGVLRHWDIGCHPREETEIPDPSQTSGAGPFCFMAAELAHKVAFSSPTTSSRHYYRHDLESFFYVLIWACVHYDLSESHRDTVHPHSGIRGWLYKDSSASQKMALIQSKVAMATLKEVAKPEFMELFESWVYPLRVMFDDAFRSIPEDPTTEDYNTSTCDGRLTFENFMHVIGEIPREVITVARL